MRIQVRISAFRITLIRKTRGWRVSGCLSRPKEPLFYLCIALPSGARLPSFEFRISPFAPHGSRSLAFNCQLSTINPFGICGFAGAALQLD